MDTQLIWLIVVVVVGWLGFAVRDSQTGTIGIRRARGFITGAAAAPRPRGGRPLRSIGVDHRP